MAEFRFRAAAVLDLRRKQETDAATVFAVEEAQLVAARERVEAIERSRTDAHIERVDRTRTGIEAGTLDWHRNWIVRLEIEVGRARADVAQRERLVREAEARWRETRRRRLAIERMRDRAWRRFQQEQHRQETKVIDELARLRFVMPDAWRDDT